MNKTLPLLTIASAVIFAGCGPKVKPADPVAPDATAPALIEVNPVDTPAGTYTPTYTFNSDEAGTITYAGGCDSATTSAVQGDNAISFNTLANGNYHNCAVTVTDANGNASDALAITPFSVEVNLTAQEQCEVDTFKNAQSASNVKINWQEDSLQFVSTGVYSRIKTLSDGRLMLVYSDGPGVVYRMSTDNGDSWGEQVSVVVPATDQHYTNAEFIELADGTWVYGYNARANSTGGSVNFEIKVVRSTDKGATWSSEILVFSGGNEGGVGVWEPAFLELPSGELQVYFANESPYTGGDDSQQISLMRSSDKGVSWAASEAVSYRSGSRDGMAVPILLNDGLSIVFSIEDNGIDGDFKPVTIRTTISDDNWTSGAVDAGSNKRKRALVSANQLASGAYGGAPYLAQFPNGETLISIQSSECRESGGLEKALMRVYIGDNQASNFSFASTPFTPKLIKPAGNALWSAITVLDDSTVMATSSIVTGDAAPNGIYTVKGTVTRN